MTKDQKNKINILIQKYNPILLESMESALIEDLFNLIIVNGDDKDFELNDLLKYKQELKSHIILEFIRLNNKPVTSELKDMKEIRMNMVKSKQGKLKL